MASIGRGRAWARATDNETVLRRPGKPISPERTQLDEFVDKIYDLSVGTSPDERVQEVITFLRNRPNVLNLDKLWERSMDDRCFGIKFIKFYKFRLPSERVVQRYVFETMQKNYERREELQEENPLRLTNLTWIIGIYAGAAVSHRMTVTMSHALLNCLSLLLDTGTEDDTETVAIQLYQTGGTIAKSLKTGSLELSDLVNKARRMLVNRNVSARSRALLLLIIDWANKGFEPLTGDLQSFYATILVPKHTPEEISRFLDGRVFDQQSYLYELLSKGMESKENENQPVAFQELSVNNSQSQEPSQKVNESKGTLGPVPRAIRGSGASESSKDHRNEKKSPRGPKEKLTDEQVWSAKQNTSSKVWGHDDRLDHNYE